MTDTKEIIDKLADELWPLHEGKLAHPRPARTVYRTGLNHGYVAALDEFHGAPCAQIRWQQEREELLQRIEALESTPADAARIVLAELTEDPEHAALGAGYVAMHKGWVRPAPLSVVEAVLQAVIDGAEKGPIG